MKSYWGTGDIEKEPSQREPEQKDIKDRELVWMIHCEANTAMDQYGKFPKGQLKLAIGNSFLLSIKGSGCEVKELQHKIRNINLEENYHRKLLVQAFVLWIRKLMNGDMEEMENILILIFFY